VGVPRARLTSFGAASVPSTLNRNAGYAMMSLQRARPLSLPFAVLPALWVIWLAVAFIIAPRLVESAWAGRTPGFLSAVMSGRSVHGVELYLGLWRRAALRATMLLALATALIGITYRFRARILPWLRPIREAISVPVPIRPRDVLLLAVWTGTVLGLVEAGRSVFYRLTQDLPTVGFFREILWVAPLASSATLVLLALLLTALALVLSGRRAALRIVPPAVAIVGGYAVIRQFGGILPLAALGLALGMTVAALRLVVADPARSASIIRRSGIAMVSVLLVYGLGLATIDRLRESLALRALPAAPRGAYNVLLLILDTVRPN